MNETIKQLMRIKLKLLPLKQTFCLIQISYHDFIHRTITICLINLRFEIVFINKKRLDSLHKALNSVCNLDIEDN
jgi:hypothetical protein